MPGNALARKGAACFDFVADANDLDRARPYPYLRFMTTRITQRLGLRL